MAEGAETHASTSSSDQSSSQDTPNKETEVPSVGGFKSLNGNIPAFPLMYPALVPGLFPPQQGQDQRNHGPGLYAVPVHPFMQQIAGFPSNNLIPFTYNLPTERRSSEPRESGGQGGEQQQQPHGEIQRQVVVRRFQIAIHLDLLLILKLAAVIFLFHQDESRQRLAALVFLATIFYLYQTGALAPVIRWLSRGMQRAAAPPQPPRPPVRAHDIGEGNENAGIPEGQPRDVNMGVEHEPAAQPVQGRLWGIVKEIQMIVFGFITSLLPGFHFYRDFTT